MSKSIYRLLIPTALVFLLSVYSYSQAITDTSVFILLTHGYAMMRVDPQAAIPYFQRAAEIDTANYQAHATLGYLYHSGKDMPKALSEFQTANRIRPSDTLKLQIAYCLVSLQRYDESRPIFAELSSSSYPDIRTSAAAQLAQQTPATPGQPLELSPWWTRIYAVSYYDTRWNSNFFYVTMEEGYNICPLLSVYEMLGLSTDTRSSAGVVPQIFSDNSLLVGVGLRARPFTGFSISAQQAASFDLIGRKDINFVREDFRFVLNYGWGIYPAFTLHDDARFPFFPKVDIYSSLGAYSKYKNTIGYLQIKGGVRPLEVSKTVFDVYGKLNFARDWAVNILRSDASIKPKEYYNNINELGAGCRLTPNVDWGIYLDAEFLRGMYSNASLLPPTRAQYYSSWRFYIIFDRTF